MSPLVTHILIFVLCAAIVWWAGNKLELYSDIIALRTNLGKALAGTLLLAVATSLPEVVTSLTATLTGDIDMAVHNLLGGVIFQTVILAFADITLRKRSITFAAPDYSLLLQGTGLILILSTTIVIFLCTAFLPHQTYPRLVNSVFLILPVIYFFVVRSMHVGTRRPAWRAQLQEEIRELASPQESRDIPHWTLKGLYARFGGASALVLVAGYQLTLSAEAIGTLTGLGSSFIGATVLAIATSLPEVSTVFASVKSDNPETAIANIFGSNCFDTVLLALVAVLSTNCVVCTFSPSATFAAALGALVTGVYLWGLLEREDRTIFGIGYDSIVVVLLCFFGFWVLYILR